MNLEHFLSKMPLKPSRPPQLPESSPESSQRASESFPDASQMPQRANKKKHCLGSRARVIFLKCIFTENVVFGIQTAFSDSFNVLLSFLAEKWYRTNMTLSQKVSSGPETCETWPKVWFLASGFCLLRLGEPSGGNWGNPNGPDAVQRFKTLYKNPLEIPEGIPS